MNLLGLGRSIFVLSCLGMAACGGTTATDDSLGAPPAKPDAPATVSVEQQTFAVSTLFLGDAPVDGSVPALGSDASHRAWKKIGFNLDGKISTSNSTDVCTPAKNSTSSVHDNGDNGIDNSFGANLLSLLLAAYGEDVARKVNNAIASGTSTLILETTGLTGAPAQTNTALSAQLFDSAEADRGVPPFLRTGGLAIDPDSLADGLNLSSGASTHFSDAYIVGGTWVSGGGSGDVTLPLAIGDLRIELVIHHAVISFARATPGGAITGTLAGVLGVEETVVATRPLTAFAGCKDTDFVATIIREAPDMLSDGTNHAGSTCDAISIGVGFIATPVTESFSVGAHTPNTPDVCVK